MEMDGEEEIKSGTEGTPRLDWTVEKLRRVSPTVETTVSTVLSVPQQTSEANGSSRCTLKCEMQLVLSSTDPPKAETLVEKPQTFQFPKFNPSLILKPIAICTGTFSPTDTDTVILPRVLPEPREVDMPFLPRTLRSRDETLPRFSKKFRTVARRHAFSKLGVPNWLGERKLLAAARNSDMVSATWLLLNGVNPDATDEKKRSALHIAASHGAVEMVNTLLRLSANPNKRDILGNTPLHLASCRGDSHSVESLIQHGADVTLKDGAGRTPLSIVTSRLNTLRQDRNISTKKLIVECTLIKHILKCQADLASENITSSIDALCNMIGDVSTREEADEIADAVIDKMSHLNIANQGPCGKKPTQVLDSLTIL